MSRAFFIGTVVAALAVFLLIAAPFRVDQSAGRNGDTAETTRVVWIQQEPTEKNAV